MSFLLQARIHPFNVLVALKTYQSGHGDKGKLRWDPNSTVCDALEEAFYNSFKVSCYTLFQFIPSFCVLLAAGTP